MIVKDSGLQKHQDITNANQQTGQAKRSLKQINLQQKRIILSFISIILIIRLFNIFSFHFKIE